MQRRHFLKKMQRRHLEHYEFGLQLMNELQDVKEERSEHLEAIGNRTALKSGRRFIIYYKFVYQTFVSIIDLYLSVDLYLILYYPLCIYIFSPFFFIMCLLYIHLYIHLSSYMSTLACSRWWTVVYNLYIHLHDLHVLGGHQPVFVLAVGMPIMMIFAPINMSNCAECIITC